MFRSPKIFARNLQTMIRNYDGVSPPPYLIKDEDEIKHFYAGCYSYDAIMQGVATYTVLTFSDKHNWRQGNAKQHTKKNKSVDHMMNIFSPRENENLHRSKKYP